MKILKEIYLQPFPIPTMVYEISKPGLRQDGIKPVPSHLLSEFTSSQLAGLCEEFITGVFTQAGKTVPKVNFETID